MLARSAFVRVVTEHRRKFEQLNVLSWSGTELSPAYRTALGEPLIITKDPIEFEARLLAVAPAARFKLGAKPEAKPRSRWPLRR